jgi:exonuclease III
MKLLVWNIQQGGAHRRQRIAEAVMAHDPEIAAFIEFTPAAVETLGKTISSMGFHHRACTTPNGADYYLCVFSKLPIASIPSGSTVLEGSGLWLEVRVPSHAFRFALVHAPTKTRPIKIEFLEELVKLAPRAAQEDFLFVGDFNTGVHPDDGPLKALGGVDQFAEIAKRGFTDAWRHFHGKETEPTYVYRKTTSYRIDHALSSAGLLPQIQSCNYSHRERVEETSDHSVLLVEIKD